MSDMNRLGTKASHAIVGGDFNIDLSDETNFDKIVSTFEQGGWRVKEFNSGGALSKTRAGPHINPQGFKAGVVDVGFKDAIFTLVKGPVTEEQELNVMRTFQNLGNSEVVSFPEETMLDHKPMKYFDQDTNSLYVFLNVLALKFNEELFRDQALAKKLGDQLHLFILNEYCDHFGMPDEGCSIGRSASEIYEFISGHNVFSTAIGKEIAERMLRNIYSSPEFEAFNANLLPKFQYNEQAKETVIGNILSDFEVFARPTGAPKLYNWVMHGGNRKIDRRHRMPLSEDSTGGYEVTSRCDSDANCEIKQLEEIDAFMDDALGEAKHKGAESVFVWVCDDRAREVARYIRNQRGRSDAWHRGFNLSPFWNRQVPKPVLGSRT
jgi:hypothetical protein